MKWYERSNYIESRHWQKAKSTTCSYNCIGCNDSENSLNYNEAFDNRNSIFHIKKRVFIIVGSSKKHCFFLSLAIFALLWSIQPLHISNEFIGKIKTENGRKAMMPREKERNLIMGDSANASEIEKDRFEEGEKERTDRETKKRKQQKKTKNNAH